MGGITNEDVKEIKKLFTGNFRQIKRSPHFDEFLIRQEGGPIWSYIGGHISADLRNILKYGFNKEVGEVPELGEVVTFLSKNSLRPSNSLESRNVFTLAKF